MLEWDVSFFHSVAFIPLTIGDHVFIGEDTIVNATNIGSHVYIGSNCVIGRYCNLQDGCFIADNSVLPLGTNVPAFAVYSGAPAMLDDEMFESFPDIITDFTKAYYQKFRAA